MICRCLTPISLIPITGSISRFATKGGKHITLRRHLVRVAVTAGFFQNFRLRFTVTVERLALVSETAQQRLSPLRSENLSSMKYEENRHTGCANKAE